MENVVILPESKLRELFANELDAILQRRIPEIIRQANRKEIMTPADLKELTGMSYRMQKYHRDAGNLTFAQDGRKVFYQTADVEKFMADRRIKSTEG